MPDAEDAVEVSMIARELAKRRPTRYHVVFQHLSSLKLIIFGIPITLRFITPELHVQTFIRNVRLRRGSLIFREWFGMNCCGIPSRLSVHLWESGCIAGSMIRWSSGVSASASAEFSNVNTGWLLFCPP